ncbi:MAG: FumA C-terminus/TtdB family hydratase beta subunit [Candidatus Firestonebacteria bacterium]|nr:FumA C-terminus/TtdB family hydratase beta subunit [Candidatus Firestonebacteria bacterium]
MKTVHFPTSKEELKSLKAGEIVYLSGRIITGRDQAHKRLTETLKAGKKLPVELKGQAIYYVGPTPCKKGEIIGACGPTTSRRMDAFTPSLLKQGLTAMIGKGNRSEEVRIAIKKEKAVYFSTLGGAAAYLKKRVLAAKIIAYKDLGPEAVYELEIKEFPAIVWIDSRGKSL